MAALFEDASYGKTASPSWYDVTYAGYNFIDGECTDYFGQLFRLDRDRAATKSGLNAFGSTTNAILSLTGAAQVTINVVAQVFGLTSNMTDVVSGTFLYDLPPATTRGFVTKAQNAYKTGTLQHQAEINSAPVAFSYIRGYLDLCLPVSIEAMLEDHVSGAEIAPDPHSNGAAVGLEVGTDKSINELSTDVIVTSPRTPVPASTGSLGPGLGVIETHMSPAQWQLVQNALCVPLSGSPDPATYKAMVSFFAAFDGDAAHASIPARGLNLSESKELGKVVKAAGGQGCASLGFKDATDVGKRRG